MTRRQFLVAATRRSSGKTTLATGLCAEFARRGAPVHPYKKGPDYIDPMWLSRAAGRPCFNLDFKTQSHAELLASVARAGADATVVVEANMALHDGSPDGADSSAALAVLLDLPVVLVVDCRGMTRSVAAHVSGYTQFMPQMRCAGVVLNRVAGDRHERTLRRALKDHTDLPVLGALYEDERLAIVERALGLVPAAEHGAAAAVIERIRRIVARQIDLDALMEATCAESAAAPAPEPVAEAATPVRVGVFRDEAFCFYYPDDLQSFEDNGAELVFINALRDTRLPEVDALFIGGGFPETQADKLEANRPLRAAVKAALDAGMPAYAECGGLMYLARTLERQGRTYEMAGVFAADAVVHDRPQGKGYTRIRETADMPWPARHPGEYFAHEFHYSELKNLQGAARRAYQVLDGTGLGDGADGIVHANVLASYLHQRATSHNNWPRRFCAFIRDHRRTSHD